MQCSSSSRVTKTSNLVRDSKAAIRASSMALWWDCGPSVRDRREGVRATVGMSMIKHLNVGAMAERIVVIIAMSSCVIGPIALLGLFRSMVR